MENNPVTREEFEDLKQKVDRIDAFVQKFDNISEKINKEEAIKAFNKTKEVTKGILGRFKKKTPEIEPPTPSNEQPKKEEIPTEPKPAEQTQPVQTEQSIQEDIPAPKEEKKKDTNV